MSKDRVWKIGSAVLILLVLCSVMSVRIQKMMRIEVVTTRGEEIRKDGKILVSFPAECIHYEGGSPVVYYVRKEKGLFLKEWTVEKKYVLTEAEDGIKVLVSKEETLDEEGKRMEIISYASHPVEEKDQVTRADPEK